MHVLHGKQRGALPRPTFPITVTLALVLAALINSVADPVKYVFHFIYFLPLGRRWRSESPVASSREQQIHTISILECYTRQACDVPP